MDKKGKLIDQTIYRGMIGSLLYLTTSKPNIMYRCLCARFQACLTESHFNEIKRIFKYLKGASDIGLWYPCHDSFELICYLDADFSGCKIDRKSTSGTFHFLGHSLVSWYSKKQILITLSMTEIEWLECAQILWRNTLVVTLA